MQGPGWANLAPSIDEGQILLGNFFTGSVVTFDLEKGEIINRAETGVERGLAGLVQYAG